MKKVLALVFFAIALGIASDISAQTTAFTYQGSLKDGTNQANGTYDLQFRLWDASSPIAGPITLEDVPVTNGVFSVNLDFGASALPGADRYLEISVRPGASTGAFTTLAPRQQVTSSPYAMQAAFAGNATTADTALNANNAANAQNADAVGGTPADQVIKEGDPRLTDMRQPTAGSASYVQINPSSPQTGNFDILGNAKVRSTLDVQGQTTLRSNTFVLGTLSGNGSGLTNLSAANVTGLGSLATVTPAGTADQSAFLRGDNSWSRPPMYLLSKANRGSSAAATVRWYYPIGNGAVGFSSQDSAMQMPYPCTLGSFKVTADTNSYVQRTFVVVAGTSPTFMNDTAISVSVSGATNGTFGTTSPNTVSIGAGQYISIKDDSAAAPAQPTVNFYFTLTCN